MFWNRQQFRNLKLMINYSKTSKILHHVCTSVICLLSLWFLSVWWKININLTYCPCLLPYVKLNVEKQLSSPKLKQSERQFRKLQILTWHLIKDLPSIWGCILSFWKVQWGSELLCWGTEIGRGEDQEVEGGLVQDWDWRHRPLGHGTFANWVWV